MVWIQRTNHDSQHLRTSMAGVNNCKSTGHLICNLTNELKHNRPQWQPTEPKQPCHFYSPKGPSRLVPLLRGLDLTSLPCRGLILSRPNPLLSLHAIRHPPNSCQRLLQLMLELPASLIEVDSKVSRVYIVATGATLGTPALVDTHPPRQYRAY